MITEIDFKKLDIRVGKIIGVDDFSEAKIPAYKLKIDLGFDIGIKKSSARLAKYPKNELVEKLVLCVVNLPSKRIGPFVSEVLTLGVPDSDGECVLAVAENNRAVIGGKLF